MIFLFSISFSVYIIISEVILGGCGYCNNKSDFFVVDVVVCVVVTDKLQCKC